MLKSGNSEPGQCALNLVRTFAGECPMQRAKGIKRELIDSPAEQSVQSLYGDIEDVFLAFEPRIDLNRVSLRDLGIRIGDFGLDVGVKESDGY